MSDIYAMGGRPLTAMNMAGFPCSLDLKILAQILKGGRDKVEEAGAVIVGGHTIDDPEPKYGMAVTGLVRHDDLTPITGAKPHDAIILTKPIGSGILATALKAGGITEKAMSEAIDDMCFLNASAAAAAKKAGAKAVTDVTGFGLLGHLYNVAKQSGVMAVVDASEVPVWPGVYEAAKAGFISGGAGKNRAYLKGKIEFARDIDHVQQSILCDPQTSGGLLIAIAANKVEMLVSLLRQAGTPCAAVIGAIEEQEERHGAVIRCV
jgi:selenide, water dikinase